MGNNRLCPEETTLAFYLSGKMPERAKDIVETHLAGCDDCLDLLCDAYDMSKSGQARVLRGPLKKLAKHSYLVLAVTSLAVSFFFHGYFLQFLAVTCLFGIKSIIDSKTTRTLVTIKEAVKNDTRRTEAHTINDDFLKK